MNLREMVDKFDLHDSLVEKIEYYPHAKILEIYIELCNWRQRSYNDNDPEIISGKFIFSRVSDYLITPFAKTFDSEEILETEIISNVNDNTKIVGNPAK